MAALLAFLACFLVANSPGDTPRIEITEVHYHPPGSEAEEFVEVHNAGSREADLSGWRFTRGVEFTFPGGARLAPGASAVVCEDTDGFRAAFGEEPRVLGAYSGRLENRGELLRLEDASGSVTDLRWRDVPPWPRGADGDGGSLTRVSVDRDTDDPANWYAAPPSPGRARGADAPRRPLSVYRMDHSPRSPAAGEDVLVTALVHALDDIGADVEIVLRTTEVDVRTGAERRDGAVAMRPASGASPPGGPRERTYEGRIPEVEARRTLIRYWIEAEGNGASYRCPPLDAPTPNGAFVSGAPDDLATSLPVYSIIARPRDLEDFRSRRGVSGPREVTFIAEGRVHDRVRMRVRGAWSRSWRKKSWKVIFNRDHLFRGRRRLNLNSSWRDPAYIREVLAYETYARCRALSLESRMVRVEMNGTFFGLFAEVEQPKESYLERVGLRGATLFKADSRRKMADERDLGSLAAYSAEYELEAGGEEAYEGLQRFCRDLSSADEGFLEERMDAEKLVDYVCATVLTQNWDAFNKNHFIACDRRGDGRWYLIPWDLDRTFGDHWRWHFDAYDLPVRLGTSDAPGPTGWNRIIDRFFDDPAMTERFWARLDELLETVFTEEEVVGRVRELERAIGPEADLDLERWGGKEDWRRGVRALERVIRERRRFLIDRLPRNLPRRPRNDSPPDGAPVSEWPVVLRSGPFSHRDPAVSHAASRWQVRIAEDGAGPAALVVDLLEPGGRGTLRLEKGRLLPETTYAWCVAHVDSSGRASPFSEETRLTTERFGLRVVSFDLSRHFDRDVVANPGDPRNDSFDLEGAYLIVDGWDGVTGENPRANGLPRDRRVGLHRLGDYDGPNAVQRDFRRPWTLSLDVPPDTYSHVRFLVSGAHGDSRVPLVFEYSDGTRTESRLPCIDWYDDPSPECSERNLQPGVLPILNGMDRIRRRWKDRNDPALFEVTIEVDAERTLETVVLDASSRATRDSRSTRFHLFAVTGVVVDED